MRPVFLIGFMATGKTTVGKLVAARLGSTFVDLDARIVEAAGSSIPDLFAREGEEGFRAREATALAEVAEREDVVVATGGGAACREANLALMLAAGRVVWLKVSPAEVLRRTAGGTGRPLLDGAEDPLAKATTLLRAREAFYARAHHAVDTDGVSPGAVAERVVALLEGALS